MNLPSRSIDRKGLPDFLIIGAQKCGSSSLHAILAEHPRIFLPRGEVFFFDIDDIEQHSDFFIPTPQGWTFHDLDGDLDSYLPWYRGLFADAPEGALLGEDSTTYLASRKAPQRIAQLLPGVKLVAILRDPVRRAYSHYWHRVRTGRTSSTFESTIVHQGLSLLDKGKYDEQLDRYHQHHAADHLHVVLFDDLVRDAQGTIDGVCAFLGVGPLPLEGITTHVNASRPPLWLPMTLAKNAVLGAVVRKSYKGRIPNTPGFDPSSRRVRLQRSEWPRRLDQALTAMWPRKKNPPMDPATRAFLQRIFRPHVERLSEQLERDLMSEWGYPRGEAES